MAPIFRIMRLLLLAGLLLAVIQQPLLADGAGQCKTPRVSYPLKAPGSDWHNDWDRRLHVECFDKAMTGVDSTHKNSKEDRRFRIKCSRISGVNHLTNCRWTGYSNWDERAYIRCPRNKFVAGWRSQHDNGKEDRRMSLRCCQAPNVRMTQCSKTGWLNGWDKPLHYHTKTGEGYVIQGIDSYHDNGKEDRRFSVISCKVQLCYRGGSGISWKWRHRIHFRKRGNFPV